MKRKLLILLMTMFMIVPLTACDDEEQTEPTVQGTTKVSVALTKGTTEGVDINLNDCARIINGPGTYDAGSIANVSVEYYPKACKFHHVVDNGIVNSTYTPVNSTNDKKIVSFNVINLQANVDRTVQIVFTGINDSVDQYKVYFDGLYYIGSDDGNRVALDKNQFAFPYKTLTNPYSTTKYTQVDVKAMYPTMENVTTETSMTSIFASSEVNLNYAYLNLDSQGFKFSPYKVLWKAGSYVDEVCTGMVDVEDITTFRVAEGVKKTCLRATIDTTRPLDATTSIAVENLVNSEIYISTKSDAECNSAITPNVSVSADCMYALRLKSIYNVDNTTNPTLDPGVYYYAINSNGQLEGVTTINDGVSIQKKYLLCKSPLAELGTCSTDNTLWNKYEYLLTAISDNKNTSKNDSYKDLAIAAFIDSLKTVNQYDSGGAFVKTTYNLTGVTVEYDYNSFIGDIAPIRIGNYYIRYLSAGTGNSTYSPINMKFTNALTENPSNKYSLKINLLANDGNSETITATNNAIGAIKTAIESDKLNLMDSTNESMIEALRLKLFSLIYSGTTYDALKGYKFDIVVNETEEEVGEETIIVRELEVTLEKANIVMDIDMDFVKINESYCSVSNNTCISELGYLSLFNAIKALMSEADIKTLKFINIKDVVVDDKDAIEFVIDHPELGETTIQYYENKFIVDEIELECIEGVHLEKLHIQGISSEVNVFGVNLIQSIIVYETGKSETIMKFDDVVVDFDIDLVVDTLYAIFYTEDGQIKGKFYDLDGDGNVDIFLDNETKVIYQLSCIYEDGLVATYDDGEYTYSIVFGEYRMPKDLLGYEDIGFVQLGEKICKIENIETCNADYQTLLAYINKLISAEEIATLPFKSIVTAANGTVTFTINLGGTDELVIVYNPTTREFTSDESKVIFYETSEVEFDHDEFKFVKLQYTTSVVVKVVIEGDEPEDKTINVIQRLKLVDSNKYKVTSYNSDLETTDPEHTLASGLVPEDDIVEIFNIFYTTGEDYVISGNNTESKLYSINSSGVFVNNGKLYKLDYAGENLYNITNEDGVVFVLELEQPAAVEPEPAE